MSYETKYHPNLCKDLRSPAKRKRSLAYVKWLGILIALILGISLRNRGFWFEFLVPGDSAVTVAAVETFSEDLKDGLTFRVAFENFCGEIIENEIS